MVCCLRFWNVRNCAGCCHGNMVAEGGAGGGALIPPRAGAQVNQAYKTLNFIQNLVPRAFPSKNGWGGKRRSTVDSL